LQQPVVDFGEGAQNARELLTASSAAAKKRVDEQRERAAAAARTTGTTPPAATDTDGRPWLQGRGQGVKICRLRDCDLNSENDAL
jgi:hypothetical protein